MKKTIILLALISFSFVNAQSKNKSWKRDKIKGNGKEVTISKTTADYDEILAGGFFDVALVAGKEGNITIKGEENLLEYINVEVENGTLKIHVNNDKSIECSSNKTIIITVPVEKIGKIKFAGSGDIYTKDAINATNLELSLTGSGDMKIETNATNLSASLKGSGDVILSGKTTELELNLVGSGDIDSSKLNSDNAKAKVAGSGDIKVKCTKNLNAAVAGSGSIHYKGKPESIDKVVNGSGEIDSF